MCGPCDKEPEDWNVRMGILLKVKLVSMMFDSSNVIAFYSIAGPLLAIWILKELSIWA